MPAQLIKKVSRSKQPPLLQEGHYLIKKNPHVKKRADSLHFSVLN